MSRFDPNEVTPIQSLLEDDLVFEKDFCTPLTVQRLEGVVPIGALRVTVKKLAQTLPNCSFSTPVDWTPLSAPQPVLTIGRLDRGGKILAPRIALGVVSGQLRLCAEEVDIPEAPISQDQWEPWAISKRGALRTRQGFMAHKAPLTDKNGEALNFDRELLPFLQWFGRRSFVVKHAGGDADAGSEPRVSWPKRIAGLRPRSRKHQATSPALKGGLTSAFHDHISAIPMTLEEAYSILPIGHTLKAAADTVLSKAAASSPVQEAERQAAQRYLRAFQLLATELGLMQKAPELGDIGREIAELGRRVLALQRGETGEST